MLFRHTYIRLIVYILLLIASSAVTSWIIFSAIPKIYIIIPIVLIIYMVYRIIKLFNYTPKKIAYFFNAVENEDSTLNFPENTHHKATAEMHKSLNRINLLIQETKLKNREQEEYYGLLLEQAATGIVVINKHGSVMQANSAAKNLLNYEFFNHIEQLKRIDTHLFEAFERLKNGDSHQFVKLTYKSTITQLSLQATPFLSHGDTLRIVSIQDISNELDAKELESWMKLIRVLTHEIMNSITPITSLSETLLRYYTFSDNSATVIDDKTVANTIKGLEVINERGVGLIHFVESYRKLTKLSKPQLQQVQLKKMIEHLLLLLTHEENFDTIDFSVHIEPENLALEIDEAQLSQVFINLLKNAMYAVDNVTNPQIHIRAEKTNDGRTKVVIQDNGVGIPAEVIDQIFIPFFSTKENGSGIGLSLSRQIIKNHGGIIEVTSEPGNTAFTMKL